MGGVRWKLIAMFVSVSNSALLEHLSTQIMMKCQLIKESSRPCDPTSVRSGEQRIHWK